MIEYKILLVFALLPVSLGTNAGCSSAQVQTNTINDYNPRILGIIESDVIIDAEFTVAEATDKGYLDKEPKMIHFEKPKYPRLPLQAGIEGTAVVVVIVDINGKVISADIVMSSVTPSMERSVLEASRKFLYIPGKRNDKAVECKVRHSIIFVIK